MDNPLPLSELLRLRAYLSAVGPWRRPHAAADWGLTEMALCEAAEGHAVDGEDAERIRVGLDDWEGDRPSALTKED